MGEPARRSSTAAGHAIRRASRIWRPGTGARRCARPTRRKPSANQQPSRRGARPCARSARMVYNPQAMPWTSRRPGRHSIRLRGHDYAGPGHYFVTLCTEDRLCLFGDVIDGEMALNELGRIADEEWLKSAEIRSEIELDRYVVMPNHMHGLVVFQPQQARPPGSQPAKPARARHQRPKRSLGSFMGGYKSAVTTGINRLRATPGVRVWQRNYWDHIVRTERALRAIRRYIDNNPARWSLDRYHPSPTGIDPMAAEVWKLLKESALEDPK